MSESVTSRYKTLRETIIEVRNKVNNMKKHRCRECFLQETLTKPQFEFITHQLIRKYLYAVQYRWNRAWKKRKWRCNRNTRIILTNFPWKNDLDLTEEEIFHSPKRRNTKQNNISEITADLGLDESQKQHCQTTNEFETQILQFNDEPIDNSHLPMQDQILMPLQIVLRILEQFSIHMLKDSLIYIADYSPTV